jgi:hypothetical protein
MRRNVLAVLPLIFLAAGASGPGDCDNSRQTLPAPVDLAGRPIAPAGLTGSFASQAFAALPGAPPGCHGGPPSAVRAETLRSDTGDALHALPLPDSLRRIDEPRRAPLLQ